MLGVEKISTKSTVGEEKDKMSVEGSQNGQISRRSTRLFAEEQEAIETGNVMAGESRYSPNGSIYEEKDKEKSARQSRCSSIAGSEAYVGPAVDVGRDIRSLFPSNAGEMAKSVATCLKAAKEASLAATKAKAEGRPMNFGTVLPGMIYRSSYPQEDDYGFLATLNLKTILTLVDKALPAGYTEFMAMHNIRHHMIPFPSTKVGVTNTIMNSVMNIALDKENFPLLIHCNHGKHRTGCVTAVLRKVAGWDVDMIVQEYSGFAEPKIRQGDVEYIKEYEVSSLQGLFSNRRIREPGPVLQTRRMTRLFYVSALALLMVFLSLMFWDNK